MNILKKTFFSLVCVAALASSTTASAFVVTDKISYNPDQPVATFFSYSYSHDISDNGYTAGVNRLLSAVLDIRLTDFFFDETYLIKVGSSQFITGSHIPNLTVDSATGGKLVTFALDASSLADLANDGKIDVKLSTNSILSSPFFLADSTLTAQVPEPLSIALMGIGFLGIGAARRKSAKKNMA